MQLGEKKSLIRLTGLHGRLELIFFVALLPVLRLVVFASLKHY